MNKKDTMRNYAIWIVLIVFYAVFYFVNNYAWLEEIPDVTQNTTHLSQNSTTALSTSTPDTGSTDTVTSQISNRSIFQSETRNTTQKVQKPNAGERESFPRHRDQQPIEINGASEQEWETLYNIGPYRAEKIVNFRTALGGFYNVDQVGETYALPDSVFREIKPHLTLESSWHRIRINHRTYDSLYQHPYVTKQMAYFIVRHRERQQPIRDMSDLYGLIQEKDHERLRKLEPYLDFSIK